MVSEAATGDVMDLPGIPEDTIDLGERLDPVRTLLRRTAGGDRRATGAALDVLGPRIHGLAVHVTGSAARASALTVSVLRSCLRDLRRARRERPARRGGGAGPGPTRGARDPSQRRRPLAGLPRRRERPHP
ncbi:hypothetical protein [Brachybacterium sp. GPGPB12]|uniref:hypothetical protein n=1 Tax=Brachybacterium sp. GPGPB12 TaxID=3023517 RepID=UPI00313453E4